MTEIEAPASAPVVAALEGVWMAIRDRHPDVPSAVVVLASGSIGMPAGALRLGHFAAMRWRRSVVDGGEIQGLPEVFVGGEGLAAGAVEVLGTLLHEAAHAIAHTRGIRDTSRQGRYHNRRYAALALEMGLDVREIGNIGWSDTHVLNDTRETYTDVLGQLSAAITLWRYSEHQLPGDAGSGAEPPTGGEGDAGGETTEGPTGGRGKSRNLLACTCECGRRIRVAASTLDAGPISCGLCGNDFQPAE